MPAARPAAGGKSSSISFWRSPKFLVFQFFVCGACGSFGFLVGINYGFHGCTGGYSVVAGSSNALLTEKECEARKLQQEQSAVPPPPPAAAAASDASDASDAKNDATKPKSHEDRFEPNIHQFTRGMAYIDRDEFMKRFDMGVPADPTADTNSKVLMLYNHETALPLGEARTKASKNDDIPTLNVFGAVRNCDFLNVVLMAQKKPKQCTAIVGQYPSYHIQKYMRLPTLENGDYGKLDSKIPLQLVNRGAQISGRKSTKVPNGEQTRKYWQTLQTYLQTLPGVLKELEPIVKKVAKDNTVVVMLANHGQSELLMNFVCSAKSRGLDISPVLVFATDQETKDLAEGMGLTVFFDKTNYGHFPTKAAGRYGDQAFMQMMFAKVYCVQMVSELGYDVLFQDVDVIWYRNALEYFHDKKSPSHGFDIYFQDDGNRAVFYAPYSANTGFYYVRANDLTRYFFNNLLMSGDLIYATKSHQIAVVAILSEYASRYGMKVKVLSKFTDEFPGGDAFHNRKAFMKDLVSKKVNPYIFHMSWTENKDNKKLFYRQLGEWYVHDKCIGNTSAKILGQDGAGASGSLLGSCCSAEPIFSCHYKDKPSREPCPNAPLIDPGNGKSFW